MKQKDYKAIAEIIKLHSQREYEAVMKSLREMLTDYFEKEDNKEVLRNVEEKDLRAFKSFNKKQFLKDCGVELIQKLKEMK